MTGKNVDHYSFLDLLSQKLSLPTFTGKLSKIEIPKIQREYVQGAAAQNTEISETKLNAKGARFIDVIFDVLSKEEPTELMMDFVYGSVMTDENGSSTFSPLDGQQRLTTLFLLHWYIGKREGVWLQYNLAEDLGKFTYETRSTSTEFCAHLCTDCDFIPGIDGVPSVLLRNRNWYYDSYNYDPTIKAMLLMLDEIHRRYETVGKKLFDRLDNLRFYVQLLNEFQLSEELYVKMNARGKPLTDFENLKADLVHWMKSEANPFHTDFAQICRDRPYYLSVTTKMDNSWTETIWKKYKGSNTDTLFFKFLCRWMLNEYIIRWDNGSNESLAKDDIFRILESEREYTSFAPFEAVLKQEKQIIYRLEKYLENYCSAGDIDLCFRPSWDQSALFSPFNEKINQRQRAVLCGAQLYLSRYDYDERSFKQWMRIVWNIAENTDINDNPSMIGLMKSLEELADHADNIIPYIAKEKLKTAAARKETDKAQYVEEDPAWEEEFLEAEKHPFFHGSIAFLLEDGMQIPEFRHRLKLAQSLFAADGLSYHLSSADKHLAIRALISRISKFSQLVGTYEWSGKHYPDKDEKEHYLKKYLAAEGDTTFIDAVRNYCNSESVEAMVAAMQADCNSESLIYKNEIAGIKQLCPDKQNETRLLAETHKRVHETLYKNDQLQAAIQGMGATRIGREWQSGHYFASKPRAQFWWVNLDSELFIWLPKFLKQNSFAVDDAYRFRCGDRYWGKRISCTGNVKNSKGEVTQVQIVFEADGTVTATNQTVGVDISDVFTGINYYESTEHQMLTALDAAISKLTI